jgi:type I restriction enzyme S subunit
VNRPFAYGLQCPGWRPTQLREFLTRQRVIGHYDLPLLSVNLTHGVQLRDLSDSRPAPSEDLSSYQVVERDDLVMNQLGKPHGSIGVSPYRGIISPAYFVANIGPSALPRFVHYLLRSRLYISEYERRGKWMPPNQFDISWEQFRSIPVELPPIDEQQAIAAYLDDETTRIDALIAKKRHMSELINERFWSAVEQAFLPLTNSMQPMARAVRSACDGPFGSGLKSSHYTDSGARVVRLGNLGRSVFRDEDEAFISLNYFQELRRHEVIPGDLLVAGLGDEGNPLGRACVAPNNLGPAIVKADCFRLRLYKGLNPHFAAWWLSSDYGGSLVLQLARGSTRQRANLGSIFRVPIPRASEEVQESTVAAIGVEARQREQLTGILSSQIQLLMERRQALITAAVTGDLKIPIPEAVI